MKFIKFKGTSYNSYSHLPYSQQYFQSIINNNYAYDNAIALHNATLPLYTFLGSQPHYYPHYDYIPPYNWHQKYQGTKNTNQQTDSRQMNLRKQIVPTGTRMQLLCIMHHLN